MSTIRAELSIAHAALRDVRNEIEESVSAVRQDASNQIAVDALAVRLHRLYGCVEDMAYRVSVQINGEVPGGSQSHKELLDRTGMEVPGKRRALWRQASLEDLHELRKFRHFFRTNYAVKLNRDKVLAVADRALAAISRIEQDVQDFIASLPATS
jgi:hypothetical protein